MSAFVRLLLIDAVIGGVLAFAFSLIKKVDQETTRVLRSLEERTMRLINAHFVTTQDTQNKVIKLQNEVAELRSQFGELLARLKKLETPPEVRAKNAADRAADELLNSPW